MNMVMDSADAVALRTAVAFRRAPRPLPFRHWLLDDVLPVAMVPRLAALDLTGRATGDGDGRRETFNTQRAFLNPRAQVLHGDCTDVAAAFQSPGLAAVLMARTGAHLHGTFLRIEYCRDVDGFWLEPHTDIGAKLFTLVLYLNTPPRGEDWGTDLYDSSKMLVDTAPSRANAGVAFVPAADTWHGFQRRPISGVRRSLIVNYVAPQWRARHELAFPECAVSVG